MKIFNHFMLAYLMLFVVHISKAQITGIIIDSVTGNPIEYANVYIQNTSINVYSNNEGRFHLNIPDVYKDNNIIISYMGYENDTITNIQSNFFTIKLKTQPVQLSEVVINAVTPLEILNKAIDRIPDNYSTQPVYLNAYYREMANTNGTFVKYADAACKIYYCGYNTPYDIGDFYDFDPLKLNDKIHFFPQGKNKAPNKNDIVQILEVRKSDNLDSFSNRWDFEEGLKKFEISGGPLSITSADIVKHRKDVINSKTWKYYHFQYEGTVSFNNKEAYKISFKPKQKKEIALWKGTMYIDKQSYAFIYFEYSVDENCKQYLKKYNTEISVQIDKQTHKKGLNKWIINRKIENANQKIRISYSEYRGKWYLSHIRIVNTIKNTGDLFDEIFYTTYLEIFANSVEIQNVTPPKEKVFATNNFNYLNHYPSKYNQKFWKKYNTPLPSDIFLKALSDLNKEKSLEKQFEEN